MQVPVDIAAPANDIILSFVTSPPRWTGTVVWQQSLAAVSPFSAETPVSPNPDFVRDNHRRASPHRRSISRAPVDLQAPRALPRIYCECRITRDANAGGDTLAADAALLGVTILFTTRR